MTPDYYNTRYTYDAGRKKVWKAICQYLSRYISPHSSILDLGSGYCDFINNISAEHKTAIDSEIKSIKYCDPDVTLLNIDVKEMNFKESTFDVVFASNLFEHLNDNELDGLSDRIHKCLTDNGKLILVQPNYYYAYREYWDDYTHKKAFSHISLSDFLISKGFRILKVEKRFLPFSFKSVFPKSFLLTKLYLKSFWHPFAKQMLIIAEKQIVVAHV